MADVRTTVWWLCFFGLASGVCSATESLFCATGVFKTDVYETDVNIIHDDVKGHVCASEETGQTSHQWPGPAINLTSVVSTGNRIFRLTWLPPADASAESLGGFLLQFHVETYSQMLSSGPSACYTVVLKDKPWRQQQRQGYNPHIKGPLLQNAQFHIDCQVVSTEELDVVVFILPQPLPRSYHVTHTSTTISFPALTEMHDDTSQRHTNSMPVLEKERYEKNEKEQTSDIHVAIIVIVVVATLIILALTVWMVAARRVARRQEIETSTHNGDCILMPDKLILSHPSENTPSIRQSPIIVAESSQSDKKLCERKQSKACIDSKNTEQQYVSCRSEKYMENENLLYSRHGGVTNKAISMGSVKAPGHDFNHTHGVRRTESHGLPQAFREKIKEINLT